MQNCHTFLRQSPAKSVGFLIASKHFLMISLSYNDKIQRYNCKCELTCTVHTKRIHLCVTLSHQSVVHCLRSFLYQSFRYSAEVTSSTVLWFFPELFIYLPWNIMAVCSSISHLFFLFLMFSTDNLHHLNGLQWFHCSVKPWWILAY